VWFARVFCWVSGHRWRFDRVQPLWADTMMHLGCAVGWDRTCRRCGLHYDFTHVDIERWGEPRAVLEDEEVPEGVR